MRIILYRLMKPEDGRWTRDYPVGTLFVRDHGLSYLYGKEDTLPSYCDLTDQTMFETYNHDIGFDRGDYVTFMVERGYEDGSRTATEAVGVVRKITPNFCTVYSHATGREHRVLNADVHKCRNYWFISSDGSNRTAWYGKDPLADRYRTDTHNMFFSKEELDEKRSGYIEHLREFQDNRML